MLNLPRGEAMAKGSNVKEKAMMTIDVSGGICPLTIKPADGCYCTSTNSIHAEATVYYCGGNFEKCDIYLRNTGGIKT
jgi:hypothetical protein